MITQSSEARTPRNAKPSMKPSKQPTAGERSPYAQREKVDKFAST